LISFDYDQGLSVLVRQVQNSRYSNTYKSWYVDDDEAVLKQIFTIFRDKAEIDISDLTHEPVKSAETGPKPVSKVANHEDVKSKSTPGQVVGVVINHRVTIEPEREIIPGRRKIENLVNRQRYSPVEFRINEQDGRLAIRFTGHYDSEWIEQLCHTSA
jgi:hypothetical protein